MKGVAATLPTPGIGKIDHKSMFHNQWQLFRGQTKRFEEKSPSGDNPINMPNLKIGSFPEKPKSVTSYPLQ